MSPLIEIKNLKKSYGGKPVLDIPELVIEQGARLAVIGANGSGKSTLLKILAGVISPDEGEVKINAAVSYMPQKPYSFGFSVYKNVALAVKGAEVVSERVKAALEAVGLWELRHRRGSVLSGGEAQRMAFARLLAGDGSLLLLDEPTSAADLEGIERMEKALIKELEKRGASLLFSTHTPSQAAALSKEMIVLDKGRIVERGETKRVLSAPESAEAAAFLSHWRL